MTTDVTVPSVCWAPHISEVDRRVLTISPLVKTSIKSGAAFVTYYSGLLRLCQFVRGSGQRTASIFMYHRIRQGNERDGLGEDAVGPTPQSFERQVAHLSARYHIVSLDEFIDAAQNGSELPPRSAVITFDDGYRDNYTLAYPILRKYKAPATIFLTTGHIGTNNMLWTDKVAYAVKHTASSRLKMPELGIYDFTSSANRLKATMEMKSRLKELPNEDKDLLVERIVAKLGVRITQEAGENLFLSWDDVRAMHDNGVSFGAHTVTHPRLTKVSKSQARAEIAESKRMIENALDAPVRAFSYPGGRFDEDIKSMVREEGFDCAVTIRRGTNSLKSDLYELRRIGVEGESFHEFALVAAGIVRG